ncbi:MAG: enoyl-CoA hydratase/isomerase family protein [Alphaproteobacteria bacterium]|nr:enoyl-CoA hydratase/isomerase family protein [Alphaproteobacteria bacterium]
MQEYNFMKVTDVGATRWLEFNRPPVNAFTRKMVEEVRGSISSALDDPAVRVVVIGSSVDLYFSAGADLKEFQGMGSEGMADWVDLCHEIVELLRNSPKPLLAAIHGTAVGGGLELTLHCDVRFASSTAQLGQPEIQIDFIPPIATTQALAHLIGRTRALRYLYSGQMLSAEEALEWGLVDHLTAPSQLRSRVQAYADDLVGKSSTALAAIRQSVTLGGGMPFSEGMQLERQLAVGLADTHDFKEGVDAFLSKRKPTWAGS